MKILHLNAGNETGGGMHHLLLLLNHLNREEFVLGLMEEGELSKRAEQLGIRTKLFKQTSQLDFSVVKKVITYIKENDIDILHTHGARANLFGAIIKSFTKCKWITTVHSDPRDDFLNKGIKGQVFTTLNIQSIKRAGHLFAISERFKKLLLTMGIAENKITTILNGIDFEQTAVHQYSREKFGIKAHELVVVMVARLEKVKDHLTALRAIKYAVGKDVPIKLLLIGGGDEREALQKECHTLKIEDNVVFLGHRDDVIDIYPLADLAILTSKSESFPLVLLEAARAQVPAVTTDVGGVNLMIPTKEYGWINDVGDASGIGESLVEAYRLKENDSLSIVGERFQQHCKGHFSIEKQVESIYETYIKFNQTFD